MNNLNNYIIEKLHIDKNTVTYDNEYLNEMLLIIQPDSYSNIKEIKKIIVNWLGDYHKRIYCYVSSFDFKYRYQKVIENNDFKKLYLAKLDWNELKNSIKLIDNKKLNVYTDKNDGNIENIYITDTMLIITLSAGYSEIIFEKQKNWL